MMGQLKVNVLQYKNTQHEQDRCSSLKSDLPALAPVPAFQLPVKWNQQRNFQICCLGFWKMHIYNQVKNNPECVSIRVLSVVSDPNKIQLDMENKVYISPYKLKISKTIQAHLDSEAYTSPCRPELFVPDLTAPICAIVVSARSCMAAQRVSCKSV